MIDIENYGALKILKTGNDILFHSYKFKRREEFLKSAKNTVKNIIKNTSKIRWNLTRWG